MFPVKNGLKQGDALSLLLFKCSLEYAIWVKQEGLKLNGTHQIQIYADVVYIMGGSVHTWRKNREDLIVASKEIGLEVKSDKTKNMVMFREQNVEKVTI